MKKHRQTAVLFKCIMQNVGDGFPVPISGGETPPLQIPKRGFAFTRQKIRDDFKNRPRFFSYFYGWRWRF